eukprot:s548_g37.t1
MEVPAPPPPPPDVPCGSAAPVIDVTSIELNPAEECAFEAGLGLAIGFTSEPWFSPKESSSDTQLSGFNWRVSYVVDTAKRRYIVQVGSTEPADYAPGMNAMTFVAEGLSIDEVPKALWQQSNGLLQLALTSPSGEEVMAVNMVVQIRARRFISGKMSQVARFAGASRQQAIDEFAHLQEKLNEAQKRLNPFKSARQDYEKRAQMRKLFEELSSKLASAEIEVEKAGMMTAPMGFDSQESVKDHMGAEMEEMGETESSLAMAQSMLAQTHRQVESKLRQKDVEGLLERCKLGQEKLDEVRKALRETQVRIAADLLMKEVSDRVANAEDEIQKMAEAELPFLRSDKDQDWIGGLGKDLATLFSEADKVSVQVHGVLAETQSFVARKMVEVAKYSEGPGQAVKEEVEMLQRRLEEGRERLQQFRSNIADRKRTHLLEEVEVKVLAAEEEVKKMTDVANILPGLGKAGEILTEQLGETLEQANQAERAAQASVVTARKFLLQKTADLKKLAMAGASGGSGSELGRLQTRVNGMQQDCAVGERQRVKQQLAEVVEKLQMVETEVEKVVANAILDSRKVVTDKELSTEQLQSIEKANGSVKVKVEQLGKLIDIKLKSASGFMQEELTALRLRLSKAEKKLDKTIQAAQEQRERILATELVAQSLELVEISETELRKAAQAELPFLKGFEIQLAEMQQSIGECEAAAAQTKKAITQARSSTMENLAKAKTFAESVASGCSKDRGRPAEGPVKHEEKGGELMALQKRLDQMAAKLTALNKETAERKRKVQLQNIKEKISSVEEAVKKFEEKVKGLNDTEILLSLQSSEEAIARFKEATSLEDAAKVLIEGTRKILAKANSDAKTLSESQRMPFMTEMGKLQSRLTPVQVQFKKLSVDCTTAEHGYVAHTLSKEVEGSLKRMAEQKDLATEEGACGGLLEDSHSKVLAVLRRDAFVDVLQELLKFVTVEELWADLAAGADSVQQNQFGERLQTRLASLPFGACITQEHLASLWPLLGLEFSGLSEAAFKAKITMGIGRRPAASAAQKWLKVKQEVDDTAGHGTAEPVRYMTKKDRLKMRREATQVVNETATEHEKNDLRQFLGVRLKRGPVPNTEANKRRCTGHEVKVELDDSTNSKGVPVASTCTLKLPWETPMMKYLLGEGPNPLLPEMDSCSNEPTPDAGNALSSNLPEKAQEAESAGIKGKGGLRRAAKVAVQPQPLAPRYLELQKMLASERERRQAAERDRKSLQERLDAMSKENGRLRAQLQVQKSLSSLSSGACWQFEMEGSWAAFTPEGNEKMHQAYLEYLNGIPDSRHAAIDSGGVARMVDFQLMQQAHLTTQKVRRIRLLTGAPPQWVTPAAELLQQGNEVESFYKVVTDQEIWDSVYKILTETGHAWDASTQCSCMRRAVIHSVHRIENNRLWHRYKARLGQMRQDHASYGISVTSAELDLDGYDNIMAESQQTFDCDEPLAMDVDEKILLHGTSWDNANSIALLRDRRVVVQNATLWDAPEGGQHVSNLYEGEHVQVVEDHPGERLHCRVLRDGRSFWVDGSEGEGRDALCSVAVASQLESLQTFIKALAAECGKSATECEQKAAKVANVAATSKLLPARNTLLEASKKMKQERPGCISGALGWGEINGEEKSNLDELQARLTAAKDAALEEHQTEVKHLEEAKAQAYMEECIGKATEAVKGAEATIQEVAEKSKELQTVPRVFCGVHEGDASNRHGGSHETEPKRQKHGADRPGEGVVAGGWKMPQSLYGKIME